MVDLIGWDGHFEVEMERVKMEGGLGCLEELFRTAGIVFLFLITFIIY